MGSKQSHAKKAESEFLCRLKYSNNPPLVSIGSKLIRIHPDLSSFAEYKPMSLERSHVFSLQTDIFSAVPVDFAGDQDPPGLNVEAQMEAQMEKKQRPEPAPRVSAHRQSQRGRVQPQAKPTPEPQQVMLGHAELASSIAHSFRSADLIRKQPKRVLHPHTTARLARAIPLVPDLHLMRQKLIGISMDATGNSIRGLMFPVNAEHRVMAHYTPQSSLESKDTESQLADAEQDSDTSLQDGDFSQTQNAPYPATFYKLSAFHRISSTETEQRTLVAISDCPDLPIAQYHHYQANFVLAAGVLTDGDTEAWVETLKEELPESYRRKTRKLSET